MAEIPVCPWCAHTHEWKCPLIKAIELHPDGTVALTEFLTPVDYHPPQPRPPIHPEWETKQ